MFDFLINEYKKEVRKIYPKNKIRKAKNNTRKYNLSKLRLFYQAKMSSHNLKMA